MEGYHDCLDQLWRINFSFSILPLLLYHQCRPRGLEKLTGEGAYERCSRYRVVAIIFEMITIINFVIYFFYPLPTPFPWPYWVSVLVAVLILIPSGALMVIGMVHAGEEATRPQKEHAMYTGIYKKVRHPQAAGEVFLWWAEEFDLVKRFGDEYVTYYQRTGAFWPKR